MTFADRILTIDRRWIFLVVAVALTVPFFLNVTCKSKVSPEVRALFAAVDALRPNSKVLVSFDYDPASEPELNPMAEAFLKFAFTSRLKLRMLGLWPPGPVEVGG